MTERLVTEEQLAMLKARLNDPWRLLRLAEKGLDPIMGIADTRQLEAMIAELEAKLETEK